MSSVLIPEKSSPEKQIIEAIIDQLKVLSPDVLLGYSATGLDKEMPLPAILVHIESINEEERQGSKAKYRMQFNISAVTKTNKDTTYSLIELARSIRTQLRSIPGTRKTTLNETQFDIAPSNSHLSFADISLQVEVVL